MEIKRISPILMGMIIAFYAGPVCAQGADDHKIRKVNVEVPFVIEVTKEQHQAILDQLPVAEIEIDKEAIIKGLSRRLSSEKIIPGEGQTLEDIANTLFENEVLRLLVPQVEKFNDLINRDITNGSVSAGFIAYRGLARTMARDTLGNPALSLSGTYTADGEGGQWDWSSKIEITDTPETHADLAADIDEDIKFDLTPFGKKHTFSWNFSCSGDVVLKKTYDARIQGASTYQGTPKTDVRVRPNAEVVATKKIYAGGYFSLSGDSHSVARKSFLHPAILKIPVVAEKSKLN